MFSGACNVMGGSLVLNPQSCHIDALRYALSRSFINSYFPQDAAIMEFNSRDFFTRIHQANLNSELAANLLAQHESVHEVFYPKCSISQLFYDECKRPGAGYSYLLSVTFKLPQQVIAFFNALNVAKGPSLGTNFTLSCPYTLFAHFNERDWAAEYGVTEHLVQKSVGLEETGILEEILRIALQAAGNAS